MKKSSVKDKYKKNESSKNSQIEHVKELYRSSVDD